MKRTDKKYKKFPGFWQVQADHETLRCEYDAEENMKRLRDRIGVERGGMQLTQCVLHECDFCSWLDIKWAFETIQCSYCAGQITLCCNCHCSDVDASYIETLDRHCCNACAQSNREAEEANMFLFTDSSEEEAFYAAGSPPKKRKTCDEIVESNTQ
jgi:hypothetical protein